MTKGEENIVLNERDELIQTIEAQQQMIFEANKQIQAQQHEIERLNKVLDDWKYNAKCDADHIAALIDALIADKDEQAGRIMRMDYLLRRTLPILEVANDQQGLIDAINALLGGTKDKPLKPAGKYETFAVPGKAPVIQGETAKSILSELGGKEGGAWVNGYCSNCNSAIPTDSKDDYISNNECRFCYYCGAKMDKEAAEKALGGGEG